MHCKICSRKSDETRLCKECIYFLDHGGDEQSLRKMYSDDKTKKIWEENEMLSLALGETYYDSVLENYKNINKKDSKENFGYNTFTDGIRLALDIAMPMMDKTLQKRIKEKMKIMIKMRRDLDKQKK